MLDLVIANSLYFFYQIIGLGVNKNKIYSPD